MARHSATPRHATRKPRKNRRMPYTANSPSPPAPAPRLALPSRNFLRVLSCALGGRALCLGTRGVAAGRAGLARLGRARGDFCGVNS